MSKRALIEKLLRTHQLVGDADALAAQYTVEPLAKLCFGITFLNLESKTKYVGDFRALYRLFWTAWGTFIGGFVFLGGLIFLTS